MGAAQHLLAKGLVVENTCWRNTHGVLFSSNVQALEQRLSEAATRVVLPLRPARPLGHELPQSLSCGDGHAQRSGFRPACLLAWVIITCPALQAKSMRAARKVLVTVTVAVTVYGQVAARLPAVWRLGNSYHSVSSSACRAEPLPPWPSAAACEAEPAPPPPPAAAANCRSRSLSSAASSSSSYPWRCSLSRMVDIT